MLRLEKSFSVAILLDFQIISKKKQKRKPLKILIEKIETMKFFFKIVFSFVIILFFNSCLVKNKGETKINLNNGEILYRTKSMSLDYLNIKKNRHFPI